MKKVSALFVALVFLWSCSTDSDDADEVMEEATIVGSWQVASFRVVTGFDLNSDGTSSDDIIDELPCFTSTITFTEMGTYMATTSDLDFMFVSLTEVTADCNGMVEDNGTYVFDGTTLTIDSQTEGETSGMATLDGDTLTLEQNDPDLGPVTLVLERQ